MCIKRVFLFGLNHENLAYSRKFIFEFMLYRAKPTINLVLSPADGLNTGFSSAPRSALKAPAEFACELAICFPCGGPNNAKYLVLYEFKNKKGQRNKWNKFNNIERKRSLHDRTLAAAHPSSSSHHPSMAPITQSFARFPRHVLQLLQTHMRKPGNRVFQCGVVKGWFLKVLELKMMTIFMANLPVTCVGSNSTSFL